MRLHENQQLFADAIEAAARPVQDGGLGIKSIFIEKDYWICRSLSLMAAGDKDNRAIFKGGTSLTKAYGIGARFSEDIDVAIAEAWTLSGNQLKNLIRRTSKNMTAGLEELVIPGMTSKGSHYHKAFYTYPRAIDTEQVGSLRAGQLLVPSGGTCCSASVPVRTLNLPSRPLLITQTQLLRHKPIHSAGGR